LTLLGCAGGLLFAEIAARVFVRIPSATERVELRKKFLAGSPGAAQGLAETAQWEDSLSLHPFFGYVGRGGRAGVNRFGFYSHHEIGLCGPTLCLEGAAPGTVVIGVFGGSLALQVASNEEALERELAPAFPGHAVKVVNFALPGHAMPQPYFVYTYFRDVVSAAVFLDGLNEIWNPVDNNRLGAPPSFAKEVHYRVLTEAATSAPLRRYKRRLQRATVASLLPLLRHSALVHLAWDAYRTRTLSSMAAWAEKASAREPFFPVPNSQLLRAGENDWLAYHRLAESEARARGALALHLLQPNLFSGSKALTAEERVIAESRVPLRNLVTEAYPALRRELAELAKSGAATADLTHFFDGDPDAVWIDPAHVNERARQALGSALVNELRKRRARISAVAPDHQR
jgi:hypothetical protein